MRDPMSVAFEIRYPWRHYKTPTSDFERTYRDPFITVWHVDPESDGSDDSCDWFNRKRKLGPNEKALQEAIWDLENILDNKPHFPDSREHKAFQPLVAAARAFLYRPSRTHFWQLPPRWHFWHWSIQVRPLQNLRRYLLTRCCKCGKGFRYGESPSTNYWDAPKIRFLRGEVGLYHNDCNNPGSGNAQAACETP